jgi:hypothetical protein
MQSMSSARQSEVKAWEEEISPCEHTLTIEQIVSGPIQASGLSLPASNPTVIYSLVNQGLHIVVPAISKKTYGYASLVALLDAAGSNLVVWREMDMD